MPQNQGNSTKSMQRQVSLPYLKACISSICQIHKAQLVNSNLKSPIPVPIHKYMYIKIYRYIPITRKSLILDLNMFPWYLYHLLYREQCIGVDRDVRVWEGPRLSGAGFERCGAEEAECCGKTSNGCTTDSDESSFTSLWSCLWHSHSTSCHSPDRCISYFATA